jgi:NADH:ubiquinone oxidoreductase subunit E
VVCDCPVCHPAGARKLLTALATAIGNSRDRSATEPVIRLKMAHLSGVCFEGPDITVDGVRHATFRNEDVLALVKELRG